jgi:hypothetical protein
MEDLDEIQIQRVLKESLALRRGRPAGDDAAPWRIVRGNIVRVYRARNGYLGLALNRPWPQPGSLTLWLSPELAKRIKLTDKELLNLPVEASGNLYVDEMGTFFMPIVSGDQISFLSKPPEVSE